MITCECVHLVTSSYFRSRKKDGGHAMQSPVGENPMLRAHFTALYVIDTKFYLHLRGGQHAVQRWGRNHVRPNSQKIPSYWRWNFARKHFYLTCRYLLHVDVFRSCDFDLDPMTFIYELDPYCLEIQGMCKYELPTWSLLKVIVWQTDGQNWAKL